MSRHSTTPTSFSTFAEIERGYLHQIRRFRKACVEIETAGPIVLNAPTGPTPRNATSTPDPDQARLELLKDQLILLRNMSAQVMLNFPGEPQAAKLRQNMDALIKSIDEKSQELRRTVGAKARKAVDPTVVRTNHLLMKMLEEDLAKNVKGMVEMYMQGQVNLPGMRGVTVDADVAYIRMTDVKGVDGFVHPSYYVVTCHPTDQSGKFSPMYVSVSPDWRTPVKMTWMSKCKDSKQLRLLVSDLLNNEHVLGKAFERDLPIPAKAVKFVHDNIVRTTVNNGKISVQVKNKDRIEETRNALRGQLGAIVRQIDPRNRDVIRDRVEAKRGMIYMTFSLPGHLRGNVVDNNSLTKIQQLLNLDPSTLQRVKTALEDPE
jgi:hypothetical protein